MFSKEQLKALNSPLPPEAVSTRTQAGASLAYVEGQYVIDALNKIFGFGGWDHRIVEVSCIAEEKVQTKRGRDAWEVAYRATVKLTVRGPGGGVCVHEDVGGAGSRLPSKGDAHENALKGAATDALKRAARCMGEQFGLALYGDLSTVDVTPYEPDAEHVAKAEAWAMKKGYPEATVAQDLRRYTEAAQDDSWRSAWAAHVRGKLKDYSDAPDWKAASAHLHAAAKEQGVSGDDARAMVREMAARTGSGDVGSIKEIPGARLKALVSKALNTIKEAA